MSLIFAETFFCGNLFFAVAKIQVTIRYVTYGVLNLEKIATNIFKFSTRNPS